MSQFSLSSFTRLSLGAIAFLVFSTHVHSQQMKKPDSAKTIVPDSALVEDSLRVRFIPGAGSLSQKIDTLSQFHSSKLLWTDGRYFGDVLWNLPGLFLRDLGEPGKPGEVNAWGTDWRGVAILMDGRPINDPITGTYNLYDLPMEFMEQVEDFSGSEAPAESWNAPGMALNFVTHQYNSLRPITKIRYVQAPNNNLMSDGLFTQNILHGLNFMFGFQRLVSDGRFNGARTDAGFAVPQGAIVDNWNVRTRLRYNFSDRLNIGLTDFYFKDINGLNGGVLPYNPSALVPLTPQNVFDDVAAFVDSPNALETVSRRDVSLLAVAKLFADSTSITQGNAYYTHLLREYSNPGSEFALLAIHNSHYAELRGIRLQQSFHSDFQVSELGILAEHSQFASNGFFDSTAHGITLNSSKRDISSVFFKSEIRPINLVRVNVSGRFDDYSSQSAPSFGAGMKLLPVPVAEFFGEYSQTYRFPTFQESSWIDSTILRPSPIQKEKHTFYRAGLNLHLGNAGLVSIAGFKRSVDNAIVFQSAQTGQGSPAVRIINVSAVQTQGLSASLNTQVGPFALDATLLYSTYTEHDTTKLLTPKVVGSGELSYQNKFFKDALNAKFGIRFHFMGDQRGVDFNPQLMLYSENSTGNVPSWSRLDLYAILKIGDAYITLSYENLLNANYYVNLIYPMPDRTLRFGVNWEFLD